MIDSIYDNIIAGNATATATAVTEALAAGSNPADILNEGMIAAMSEIGRRFEDQECFVPEMLVSARAMKTGLEILRPQLVAAEIEPIGKVILGTVQSDLHDIGKNLVGMMLEGAGFEVIDLGTNVLPDEFVAAVAAHKPQFIGISALLTTTMTGIQKTIEALADAELRDQVRVMIGGAPVTQDYADAIGADLYAKDAAAAAARAKALV